MPTLKSLSEIDRAENINEETLLLLMQDAGRILWLPHSSLGNLLANVSYTEQQQEQVRKNIGASSMFVCDGKVCTMSADISGDRWHQVEAAAKMDEPYLNEWGWKCAQEDETTELYKWIYRCLKEGFSVPYRTIVVDGVEHRFETELTERDREWVEAERNTVSGLSPIEFIERQGGDRNEATWFCLPLVHFAALGDQIILQTYSRVQHDNPLLCAPPAGNVGLVCDDESGLTLFAYFIYRTESTADKITYLIEKATTAIDKYVQAWASDPEQSRERYNKEHIAEIIHDYIILNNDPATVYIEGAGYTPQYYQPTLYAALDPLKRALCEGYTQAFNYFARLYGINSLAMTADVDHIVDGESKAEGGHIWNIVNFGEYGNYSANPAEWSPIDVYWDEPLHEADIRPDRVDLPAGEIWWEYFGNPVNVFKEDYLRNIEKSRSYGRYPFDNKDGSTPCPSMSIDLKRKFEDYVWEAKV